jgi:hypothetical protein
LRFLDAAQREPRCTAPGTRELQAIALHLTGSRRAHLICPSCQRVAGAYLVTTGKSKAVFRASSAREEGRFAIVTKRGAEDAVDANCATDECADRGRRSRVVLASRRWRQVGDNASHCVDDGDKKARSPKRARRKPLKPLRRECRHVSAIPVVTCLCAFYFRTQGCGCGQHPAFPAPSVFWRGLSAMTRWRFASRER